jgi:hypothetical protein
MVSTTILDRGALATREVDDSDDIVSLVLFCSVSVQCGIRWYRSVLTDY